MRVGQKHKIRGRDTLLEVFLVVIRTVLGFAKSYLCLRLCHKLSDVCLCYEISSYG
jgi:hypothetical protein